MTKSYRISFFRILGTLCLGIFFTVPLATTSAEADQSRAGFSGITVQDQLEKQGGDFSDIFLNLKQQQPAFRYLCRKHRLDDPAVWPTLQQRFVLNLAELQGQMSQAESMIATKDTRGGLNKEVISAEKTRAKGRNLKASLERRMDEMRQMLRLIEEFQTAFAELSAEGALTGQIELANKAGQSLTGQVLFMDGNDLVVKRADNSYFRIPAHLLSEATKLAIFEAIVGPWEELPGMAQDTGIADKNAGKLIAYSDTHLYIEDRFEGFVSVARSGSEFVFTPYAEQLEAAEATLAKENLDREAYRSLMETLRAGRSLNQSRVETIEWYESRLIMEIPESERKEAKAYREEKYGNSEVQPDPEAPVEDPEAGSTEVVIPVPAS